MTTWIEILPEKGAFLYADAMRIRRKAGEQVSIKSDEAGLSIRCIDANQAQEIITQLRKLATLEGDYNAWIIADDEWQNWSPEKSDEKPITIPGRSARRTREKNKKND